MSKRRAPVKRPKHPTIGPTAIPALTHGQVLWLLTQIGLHHGATESSFNYYVKSLRKLDVPFPRGKGQELGHRHVKYAPVELMELAVALLLRAYGILPDEVVAGLRDFRKRLYPLYRRAYAEAFDRAGQSIDIRASTGKSVEIRGLYVDLNIRHERPRKIKFGPPRRVSPYEAINVYASADEPARPYLPLNLSRIAGKIIAQLQDLPPVAWRRWPRRDMGRKHN